MTAAIPARDRLLDTASRLFYDRGIAATGVDTVVAAAGVSKPTLYAHFGSKAELVAAVLQRRHTRRVSTLQARIDAASEDPRERLLAVFDWLPEFFRAEGVRGCAFLNAAAESPDAGEPAREVARRNKRWMREYLACLAAEAGLIDADQLGSELLLVLDGASSRMVVEGDVHSARTVAAQARHVATILIDAAAPTSDRP